VRVCVRARAFMCVSQNNRDDLSVPCFLNYAVNIINSLALKKFDANYLVC